MGFLNLLLSNGMDYSMRENVESNRKRQRVKQFLVYWMANLNDNKNPNESRTTTSIRRMPEIIFKLQLWNYKLQLKGVCSLGQSKNINQSECILNPCNFCNDGIYSSPFSLGEIVSRTCSYHNPILLDTSRTLNGAQSSSRQILKVCITPLL